MTGCLFNSEKTTSLFASKGTFFKVTVKVRGKGKLKVAFRCVNNEGKYTSTYSSTKPLLDEEKTLVYSLCIRDADSYFRPFFLVENDDEAFISDFDRGLLEWSWHSLEYNALMGAKRLRPSFSCASVPCAIQGFGERWLPARPWQSDGEAISAVAELRL